MPEMTQMLELSNKDFKPAIIKILQWVMLKENFKKRKKFIREIEDL
jgi:hypothetical protein